MVENNEKILTDAIMQAVGGDKCNDVLELAYKNGYNKHSDEFDRPDDTAEDYPQTMNTKLNSARTAGTATGKPRKKVNMATQEDFEDF